MNKTISKTISVAIFLAIAGGGTIWFTMHAKAQGAPTSEYYAYPMLGIARGQTARLNVVTVGIEKEMLMELSFLDSQGRTLARSVERAIPGRAVSLALHFASVPRPVGDQVGGDANRVAIRALVRLTDRVGHGGYILNSLEVIDDVTGRTLVLAVDPAG